MAIRDEQFYKLSAQVSAIEMVLRTVLAMQLVNQVKDPLQAGEMADTATKMKDRLSDYVTSLANRPEAQIDPELSTIMLGEMRAAISRCFDQSAGFLTQIAQIALDIADPPSDAKN